MAIVFLLLALNSAKICILIANLKSPSSQHTKYKVLDIWTPVQVQSAWFQVIHDLISTNARLAQVRLRDTDKSPLCGSTDPLLHRLTECNDMADIWVWTRARIALMLRTNPRYTHP
jgi:hypothetical protein